MSDTIRHNFSVATKRLLAERAGYCCTAPNCGKATIAACFDSEESSGDGVAAHIVSASPNSGPRADSNFTEEQRKSFDNGIWLCSNHARIIDSDELRFTVELLKRWKVDHEMKTAYRVSGQWIGSGIIASISLRNIGRFQSEEYLSFGKFTLLLGANATGKTLICDFIAGLQTRGCLEKWTSPQKATPGLIKIETFGATARTWEISVSHKISCRFHGQVVPAIISGFRVIYGRKRFYSPPRIGEEEADKDYAARLVDAIASHLEVTSEELLVILQSLDSEPGYSLAGIRVREGMLEAMVNPNSFWLSFARLSEGEKQTFLIEIICRLARYHAQMVPTVLVFDQELFGTLDLTNTERLLEYLASGTLNCQAIVNLYYWKNIQAEGWRSWLLEGESCASTAVKIVPWTAPAREQIGTALVSDR